MPTEWTKIDAIHIYLLGCIMYIQLEFEVLFAYGISRSDFVHPRVLASSLRDVQEASGQCCK